MIPLQSPPVHALGITQILNWGILFYTPALLSKPIALDTGFSLAFVYGACLGFTERLTLYKAALVEMFGGITYYLESLFGWRVTLFIFAAVMFLVSLPLHWFFIPAFKDAIVIAHNEDIAHILPEHKRKGAIVLFTLTLTLSSLVFAAFLLVLSFIILGLNGVILYVFFYGAGQGLLTIVRGAVPLALFGRKGYGALSGKILTPSLLISAFTPLGFGLFLEHYGAYNGLIMLLIMSLLALVATFQLYRTVRAS